jgi:small-conductance mechanosensitive channel
MAKLPIEESEVIWTLKRQLLEIINTATAAEETLFSNHGETELTVAVLDELKRVSERATPWFSRLSNLQVLQSPNLTLLLICWTYSIEASSKSKYLL